MPYALGKEKLDTLVIKQQYDANASIKNMNTVKGTVFELVLKKPIYWILCAFHYLVWFLKEYHDCSEPNAVKHCTPTAEVFKDHPLFPADIKGLSSLVTFFVVFYNGNCYGRYNTMYDNVIAIQGKLHNIGLYLRAYYTVPSSRWNVLRYLLASHYLFYWSLKERYHKWHNSNYKTLDIPTFKDLMNQVMIPKGLLIEVEAAYLATYPGNKHKLLYSWSVIAMKKIMNTNPPKGEKGSPMLNSDFEQTALLTNLKEEIVGMRGAIGTIDNGMLFPIPFQYYHVVNLTLWIWLFLLAYAMLFINGGLGSVFSLIAYPLITFVMLGLVEVANAMSDPFGGEGCGFNQDAIQQGIYDECKRLCEEPEEDFISQLGDPSFNPTRNADGTLSETPAAAADTPAAAAELTWSQADVQAVMDERDQLKKEFAGLGIDKLSVKITELVDVQLKVAERLQLLDNIPKELQAANHTAVDRVARIEELLTEQISRLQGDLRGDPYEARYVGIRNQNPAGSDSISTFVQPQPPPQIGGGPVFQHATGPGQGRYHASHTSVRRTSLVPLVPGQGEDQEPRTMVPGGSQSPLGSRVARRSSYDRIV
mmetsp:Transcript_57228/g.134712  ORF Transcript_57228/g.134712 Transcript_57228/m.134712 type:complete len:592 (+) Transcript_57228:150-1925(+)|eukprot:CAMPEP_0177708182 /NCGR_PEP_ID=MMETSP0484_2-20121128/10145_1 /TAXON_ID=354590 /ORGANISM="Rhodomonas lens, Strain RHODO" /LENGTH=591 /DNA_ID=CAMNT_0019219739 /DNA_START=141 /DNA_END=1916 /DNA_ORIENTATION=-